MGNDRDSYTDKHGRQPTNSGISDDHPDDSDPEVNLTNFDDLTPVGIDPIRMLSERQRRTSRSMNLLERKVIKLDAKMNEQAVQIVRIELDTKNANGKLDQLVTASQLDAKSREDRRAAAALERREAEERAHRLSLEDRKERLVLRKMNLSILVPTVTAILAGIAAIVAALAK